MRGNRFGERGGDPRASLAPPKPRSVPISGTGTRPALCLNQELFDPRTGGARPPLADRGSPSILARCYQAEGFPPPVSAKLPASFREQHLGLGFREDTTRCGRSCGSANRLGPAPLPPHAEALRRALSAAVIRT